MQKVFFSNRDQDGEPLPAGQVMLRHFGEDAFAIELRVREGSEAAEKFIMDLMQVLQDIGEHTPGDVGEALSALSRMEAYFTTWRKGPKLVPASRFEALQRGYEDTLRIKQQLQEDNERLG